MVAFGFLSYKLSFCSKRNAASVVLTMLGGRDTAIAAIGDTKSFQFSLAPEH